MPDMPECPVTIPNPPMVDVAIKRLPGAGVGLTLTINAQPLHNLLDGMGVPRMGSSYQDLPREETSTVDIRTLCVSTHALLKRTYPVTIQLRDVINEPISHAKLLTIAASVKGQTQRILDHYRPVDIRTRVYSGNKGD